MIRFGCCLRRRGCGEHRPFVVTFHKINCTKMTICSPACCALCKVEEQYLGIRRIAADLERRLFGDCRTISGVEFFTVKLHAAASNLQPSVTVRCELILYVFTWLQ